MSLLLLGAGWIADGTGPAPDPAVAEGRTAAAPIALPDERDLLAPRGAVLTRQRVPVEPLTPQVLPPRPLTARRGRTIIR